MVIVPALGSETSPCAKPVERRGDPLRLGLRFPNTISLGLVIALSGSSPACAAEQPSGVPAWLAAHVGEGQGQIAQPVLQRARALYLQKLSEGGFEIPATSLWTQHVPTIRAGAGFTSFANPTGHFTPSRRATVAAAI